VTRVVEARCHCGAVAIRAELDGNAPRPTRCTCSFCRRRQAANVAARADSLEIVQGADALRLYQFGTGTAQHFFCGTCGIYTHHRRRSDPSQIGINLGCIEGAAPWEHEPIDWTDGINHPSDRA
jgi:hypothetical protein